MECSVSDLVKRGHEQAAELKSSCGAIDVRSLAQLISDLASHLDVQLARSNALATENAALKSAKEIIRHLNANREEANFCGIDDCHIDDAVEAMLTPATDVFLAEVRASAIEAFADNQAKIADEELVGGNLDLSLRFRGMARAAKEFAAQLRREAAMDSEPEGEFYEDGPLNWYQISDGDRVPAHRRIPLYRHAQQPVVESEFIPKNLDKALGVVGVALPESKEEFNFQSERWIQRLIDRVIRYADEFKEQPAPVVPEEITSASAPEVF